MTIRRHRRWGEAARQVVTYRTVYTVAGDDPLGPRPDPNQPGRQLQAWQAAHHALTACTHASTRRVADGRGTTPRPPHRHTNATPGSTTTAAPTDQRPQPPPLAMTTTNKPTDERPHRVQHPPDRPPAATTATSERVEDLPLIVEQLLDQLDDLQQAVEAQQRLIAVLTSRVTALEHQPHHD